MAWQEVQPHRTTDSLRHGLTQLNVKIIGQDQSRIGNQDRSHASALFQITDNVGQWPQGIHPVCYVNRFVPVAHNRSLLLATEA